ncbi:MAG: NAD(P)/FAD-dependent oxidoreductase [Synergistaceae bacterium]|jgi:glycerol-3-phosphate dehydrogenase|nr:NAD(P)/FAD-dependent oxidoreductase [Synergistaceae bacterium]
MFDVARVYDAVIIGAGVVGCAVARELSRFDIKTAVIEKEPDVGWGTSSRNSGVLHSGINYGPGTRRAMLSVLGNSMMDALCSDLKVPLRRTGKLTIALDENDLPGLEKLHEQGKANVVPGMELLDNEAMRRIQPGVEGILGLWTPTSAIISPYGLTIALAENARENGVDFYLSNEVTSIRKNFSGVFGISTRDAATGEQNAIKTRTLVNSAGLRSDSVSRMLGVGGVIYPCRGEYFILDKRLEGELRTLLYPVPGPNDPGLGIHLTPTVDGNILIGPSADYVPDGQREDYSTTIPVLDILRREGQRLLPSLGASDYIRNFSGNRPKQTPPDVGGNADFTIEETDVSGFIRLQGIESPGLTSAPAIAAEVRGMLARHLRLREKENFVPRRSGLDCRFADLPNGEKIKLSRACSDYGEIICRCENVTKKEVRDAIENPLGARTLKGIKYRSRAMMGRCQGGFCLPRIMRMLREDYAFREKYVPGLTERLRTEP